MNRIYIFEGSYGRGKEGETLVLKSLMLYCDEFKRQILGDEVKLIKDQRGKPYFEGIDLQLSISHSGPMWMCLISPWLCGIDIQEHREIEHEKLAKRFFNSEEYEYVRRNGKDSFFEIWSRKEAFVKCTGQGLFTDMPSLVEEGCLADELFFKDNRYSFENVQMGDGFSCVICFLTSEKIKENAEIRLL